MLNKKTLNFMFTVQYGHILSLILTFAKNEVIESISRHNSINKLLCIFSVIVLFKRQISRDVKASRLARPRGQIMWPRPRPHSVVASASCILASWPRIFLHYVRRVMYLVTSS